MKPIEYIFSYFHDGGDLSTQFKGRMTNGETNLTPLRTHYANDLPKDDDCSMADEHYIFYSEHKSFLLIVSSATGYTETWIGVDPNKSCLTVMDYDGRMK